MPPQEGVKTNEDFKSAFYRCLTDECGFDLASNEGEKKKKIYIRAVKHLGILDLPRNRWGERSISSGAEDHVFESVTMTKKAYWAVIALVNDPSEFLLQPNQLESIEVNWVELSEASNLINISNRIEKAELIMQGLDESKKHINHLRSD